MKFSQIFLAIYIFALVVLSTSTETNTIANLLGIILVFTFLIESLLLYGPRIKWHKYITYLIVFALFSLVGISLSDIPQRYISFLLVLGLFFTVFNIVRRDKSVTGIKYGLIGGILYSVAFNYNEITLLISGISSDRLGGTIGNANAFSFLMITLILILLKSFYSKNNDKFIFDRTSRAIDILLIILCSFLTIAATGSRKGVILLSLIFLGTYLFVVKEQTKFKKILITIVGGICLIGFSSWFAETSVFNRFENVVLFFKGRSVSEHSIGARSDMIQVGLNLWSQHPLIGWGFDAYEDISGFNTYSHSNFIELLANNGLIGLILYYCFSFSLLISSLRLYRYRKLKDKGLLSWTILVVVVLLAWDIAAVSYYSKPNWILYGVALASMLNAKEEEKTTSSSRGYDS